MAEARKVMLMSSDGEGALCVCMVVCVLSSPFGLFFVVCLVLAPCVWVCGFLWRVLVLLRCMVCVSCALWDRIALSLLAVQREFRGWVSCGWCLSILVFLTHTHWHTFEIFPSRLRGWRGSGVRVTDGSQYDRGLFFISSLPLSYDWANTKHWHEYLFLPYEILVNP